MKGDGEIAIVIPIHVCAHGRDFGSRDCPRLPEGSKSGPTAGGMLSVAERA